jgi:hypothetical protein
MKIKSAVINLSLGFLGSLLVSNFPQYLGFNSEKASAQTPSCPLSADIAVTFLNSECKEVVLDKPQNFYRYFGNNVSKYGRYLTSDQYKTNVEVIRNLALDQSWQPPNPANMKVTVTLPVGTTVYQGIVAPQNPASCYPGGGQQTFIKDSRDPNIKWSEGESITVEPFSCP